MAGLTKKEIEFAIIINKTATKLLYTITTLPTYTSNNNIIIIIILNIIISITLMTYRCDDIDCAVVCVL